MLYRVPHEDIEFEIPDDWWELAGAIGFTPSQKAFAAFSDAQWPTTLVPIKDVAAPRRNPGVEGLLKERTVSILRAFVTGAELPPVEVEPGSLAFRVRDGFHRYYLSIAAGFCMLPVSIRPSFDFNAR